MEKSHPTIQLSSDISPTAAQMPRLVGLAQASKVFRHLKSRKRTFVF